MKTVGTPSTDARAWQALGRFWAGVLTVTALGAAVLAWLGPPEPAPVAGSVEAAQVLAAAPALAPDVAETPDRPLPVRQEEAAEPPHAQAVPPASATQPQAEASALPWTAPPLPTVSPLPMVVAEPPAGPRTAAAAGPMPRVVGPDATPPAVPPPLAAPPLPASSAPQATSPHRAAAIVPMTLGLRAEAPIVSPPLPAALPPLADAAPGPIRPPDPSLSEASRHGPLPRIGPDGSSPARFYARGFDRSQPGPRVAVLVGGVGMSARLAEEAIARLPPAVSLALSPYAPNPEPILAAARARGIETLMSLPFEPQGWPLNDPGDQALLTGLPMEQNLDRLFWALSRAQGQIGAVGALGPLRGERFAAQPGALEAVQRILASRGLIYVDPRPGAPGPAFAWGLAVDLVLDEPPGAAAIDARLAALEARARERGSAVGYAGDPSPVLVARIAAWAEGLARRGVVLAPVSAMIRRPEPR